MSAALQEPEIYKGLPGQICAYHGRSYATRSPLCETPACPNVGNNVSKEWGNDGKWIASVLRCDVCYPFAQEQVRQLEENEESKQHNEKMKNALIAKALELGKALLTAEEREFLKGFPTMSERIERYRKEAS